MACSGATRPVAPTNGTVGAAGDTSRPYKWGLICRGGSITSRPYKCCTYKRLQPPSSSSGHSLLPEKKGLGGLGHLPKNSLLREEGFGLKSFGGEAVEGKKMLFHTFLKVLMVG